MADINKGNLRRFSDMRDVDIAEGDPDPRGWEVMTPDGRELGEVKDLVIDTTAMKVRCLEVSLDKDAFGIDEDRRVLLPIETAQLDHDDDRVIVRSTREAIASLPAFSGRAEEAEYYRGFGDHGRSGPSAGERGSGSTTEPGHRTRDDELRILQRPVSPEASGASKRLETEHARQSVTRQREEARAESRPSRGDDTRGASIGEGAEVALPPRHEDVAGTRRPSVREDLTVGSDAVTEGREAGADVRKEPVDVEKPTLPRDPNRREGR